MDSTCKVPGCGSDAVVGDYRQPFGKDRWGVHLEMTVEDLAVTWPLCQEHGDALLVAAFDAVGGALADWGLEPRYRGLEEKR